MVVKKNRIRYKRLFIFLLALLVLVVLIVMILNIRISNIYVSGNSYLSDQKIIETARLNNYPKTFFNSSLSIKRRISSNLYIESVKVRKKGFTRVYIDVIENRPLCYSSVKKQSILKNGEYSSDMFNVPILTNDVSSSIFDKFLEKLSLISISSLDNISEITYTPNDVDNELFLFSMNDGNYVYINLNKFESINRYSEMVTKFDNHKGILYLDSGEYFKILDN